MQCEFCDRWLAAAHMSAHYNRCLLRRLTVSYHLLDDSESFAWMRREDEYESNLRLQESMGGPVLIGVPDIDAVTLPCRDVECCPVCMEAAPAGRRTLCGHLYCAPCIERWLTDHKRCPVCNTDLVEATTPPAISRARSHSPSHMRRT